MQPGTIEVPLSHFTEKAPHRPPGYINRCLSMGYVEGDKLVLTQEAYVELKAEFDTKCQGCGQ